MTTLAANIGLGEGPTFDANGDFVSFNSGKDDFVNTCTYNTLGEMTGIEQTANQSSDGLSHNGVTSKYVALGYDGDGLLSTVDMSQNLTDTSNVDSGSLVAHAQYTYDGDSDLTDLTYNTATDNTGTVLAGYHWDYNAAGAVSDEYSLNDTKPSSSPNPQDYTTWAETTYSYDPDAQLIGAAYSSSFANAPSTFGASYDPNGNRTSGAGVSPASSTNRLLFDGTYYYTYDAEGNRTAKWIDNNGTPEGSPQPNDTDITIYTWNNANEMTSAKYYNTYSDYHNGTVTATGEYAITYGNDAFGRMVMRTAVVGQGGTTTTSTENFIYCGQNIVLVLNGSGQVIERNLTGPAADEVFATEAVATVLSGPQAAGTVNWYLTDNQGTVRDVVQLGDTTPVDHLVYSAFGQLLSQTASAAGDQPTFYYNGTYRDPQTGQNLMGLRWQDPVDGDWDSEDPISFGGGQTNLMEYCGDDPTNFIDPSGRAPIIGVYPPPGNYVSVPSLDNNFNPESPPPIQSVTMDAPPSLLSGFNPQPTAGSQLGWPSNFANWPSGSAIGSLFAGDGESGGPAVPVTQTPPSPFPPLFRIRSIRLPSRGRI